MRITGRTNTGNHSQEARREELLPSYKALGGEGNEKCAAICGGQDEIVVVTAVVVVVAIVRDCLRAMTYANVSQTSLLVAKQMGSS